MTAQAPEAPPPSPEDYVRAQLGAWVAEGMQLRAGIQQSFPVAGSAPRRYAESLVLARAALDRVEELLGNAISMRAQVRRWAADHERAVEDAFDTLSQQERRTGRRDDYSTGRERQADVNLRLVEQRRTARAAERLRQECEEAHDRLRLIHDGLTGTRQDLSRVLGFLQWESHLER